MFSVTLLLTVGIVGGLEGFVVGDKVFDEQLTNICRLREYGCVEPQRELRACVLMKMLYVSTVPNLSICNG